MKEIRQKAPQARKIRYFKGNYEILENPVSPNFEKFCSINGPTFYKLPVNADQIELIEERWTVPEYTMYQEIKIKNFMGGKEINWKLKA